MRALGTTDLGDSTNATWAIRVENQGPLGPLQWEEVLYFSDLDLPIGTPLALAI
jgi:hypothetical protein